MANEDTLKNIHYPRIRWRSRERVQAELDRLLTDIRQKINTGLHLGAGGEKLPGLINCDLFHPEADMKVDSTNLNSFSDNSIDLIESHHMIEHLSFSEAQKALNEWFRVLRPGGILILTCPDITKVCLEWLKQTILYSIHPRSDALDYILKMMFGSQEHDGMFHKSGYDERLMRRVLATAKFSVEFSYSPYPKRLTPSLLTIARKPI